MCMCMRCSDSEEKRIITERSMLHLEDLWRAESCEKCGLIADARVLLLSTDCFNEGIFCVSYPFNYCF